MYNIIEPFLQIFVFPERIIFKPKPGELYIPTIIHKDNIKKTRNISYNIITRYELDLTENLNLNLKYFKIEIKN